jgi:hypothetical protein
LPCARGEHTGGFNTQTGAGSAAGAAGKESPMNMKQVRAMAKTLGINVVGMDKIEAIRSIQRTEGNFDCFARAKNGYCDQMGCLFYEDCMKSSQQA